MKRSTLVGATGGLLAGVAAMAMVSMAAPSVAFWNKSPPGAEDRIVGQNYVPGFQPVKWAQPGNLADLVESVSPSVVQIIVRQPGRVMGTSVPEQFKGTPFEDYFERRSQGQDGSRGTPDAMASGSGFFIDPRGYIVTNNHVVDNAKRVTVRLRDGNEVEAKVVGVDPKTDLAVIKVEPGPKLGQMPAALSWGDSAGARPGDNIFAVGSPFGLGNTVTAGIISARGRDIGSGPYDDYIQVDAPINQGNSGGPLFNATGQVIGVNSAIYSPSGGNVGIGFSIPAELASSVVAQIINHGGVDRGWLGVSIDGVSRATADGVGLAQAKGALIQEVTAGGPAAAAGLRAGDIIVMFGDRKVDNVHDLTRVVAETAAGASKDVKVWRDGREQTIKVKIAALSNADPAAAPKRATTKPDVPDEGSVDLSSLGLSLGDGGGAAVVADVDVNSTAWDAGIRPGDKVLRVGASDVKSAAAAGKLVKEAEKSKGAVLLQVERNGNKRILGVPFSKD